MVTEETPDIIKQLIDLAETREQIDFLLKSENTQDALRHAELKRNYEKLLAEKNKIVLEHEAKIKVFERLIGLMFQTAMKRDYYGE